jgi:hypothetical protein
MRQAMAAQGAAAARETWAFRPRPYGVQRMFDWLDEHIYAVTGQVTGGDPDRLPLVACN